MAQSSSMRFAHLTFDSLDKHNLARFWAELLQWEVASVRDEVVVRPPESPDSVVLVFLNVPEEKRGKNRCHPDIYTNNLDEAISTAKELGAIVLAHHQEHSKWGVLQDPEGNEFCLIERPPLSSAPDDSGAKPTPDAIH